EQKPEPSLQTEIDALDQADLIASPSLRKHHQTPRRVAPLLASIQPLLDLGPPPDTQVPTAKLIWNPWAQATPPTCFAPPMSL
ncbi:hypothetical protein KCU74_g20269, partial [Aureobasidium melanogenum]